jgi:NADH-quinone oxidoreductase subunit C
MQKTIEAIQQLKARMSSSIIDETEFCGEICLQISKEELKSSLAFLKMLPNPGFEVLMDLTGVDYLEPTPRTKVVYWLHNPSNYERIRINVYVLRGESLPSVVDLWEGADWYERELFDLFGVNFIGHPELKRILMPDDWKGHPLRRDYALTEESVEFKHGVTPKIPSKIIPYVIKSVKKS